MAIGPLDLIKKIISSAEPSPFIAVVAQDRVRRERALAKLTEGLGLQAESQWKYPIKKIRLSQAKEQDLQSFIKQSTAQSLFSKKQIFFIEELEKLSAKQTDILEDLFKANNTSNYFFFTGTNLLSTSRLAKELKKLNTLIELEDFDLNQLGAWIKQEFKSRGLEIENRALNQIAQNCEQSVDQALQKIDLLELYASSKMINLSMIEELFPSEISISEFAWVDALNAGNKQEAKRLIRHQLNEGKVGMMLLGLLQSNYSNYFLIAELNKQGLNQTEIRSALKIIPWLFNKQYSIASQKNIKSLKKDLQSLALADSKLKNKSLGDQEVLYELINNLS